MGKMIEKQEQEAQGEERETEWGRGSFITLLFNEDIKSIHEVDFFHNM